MFLQACGELLAAKGYPQPGVVLICAANQLYPWLKYILCPRECEELEQARTVARAALGEEEYTAACRQGQSMTKEQAIAFAQEKLGELDAGQHH